MKWEWLALSILYVYTLPVMSIFYDIMTYMYNMQYFRLKINSLSHYVIYHLCWRRDSAWQYNIGVYKTSLLVVYQAYSTWQKRISSFSAVILPLLCKCVLPMLVLCHCLCTCAAHTSSTARVMHSSDRSTLYNCIVDVICMRLFSPCPSQSSCTTVDDLMSAAALR